MAVKRRSVISALAARVRTRRGLIDALVVVSRVALPLVSFGLSWALTSWIVAHAHFLFAIPVVWFFASLSVFLIRWVFERSWEADAYFAREGWSEEWTWRLPAMALRDRTAFCVTAALLLTTVGAWVSYGLNQAGLAPTLEASAPPTYDNLVQTYLWHLVDAIPLTSVKVTFGFADPLVLFSGWLAGLPILGFRLFVIVILFGAVRLVWTSFFAHSAASLVVQSRQRAEAAKPERDAERA